MQKKADYNTKCSEIERKVLNHDHSKYINTQKGNKSDTDDFLEKTNFDDKLTKLKKKVTSNKTKHVEGEK